MEMMTGLTTRRVLLRTGSAAAMPAALALAGCRLNEPREGEPPSQQPANLTYVTWRPQPEPQQLEEKAAALFTAKRPHIKVSVTQWGYGQYLDKMGTLTAAGTPPDAIHVDTLWIPAWAEQGVLLPLGERLKRHPLGQKENIYPQLWPHVTYQGKPYVVPFATSVMALFHHRDLFAEVGLKPPDASWQFEDLLNAAQRLTRDRDGDGAPDQWGVMGGATGWWVSLFGGRLVDDHANPQRSALEMPETVRAVQTVADLTNKYRATPPAGAQNNFYAGRTAMMFNWGAQVLTARRDVKSTQWDIARTSPLSPVRPLSKLHLNIGVHAQGVAKTSPHQEQSWAFVEWLTTEYVPIWARELGYGVPANTKVANSPDYLVPGQLPPSMKVLVEEMQYGLLPHPMHPRWAEAQGLIDAAWREVMAGKTTAAAAHKALTPQIDAILRR
ncbi:MAG: sugar ABC transporter substrate-binding protein [Chloroflexi bacterium]|nr:sugar ABC transporter substrate-binding protein [Chloroflexota bacterium]